MYKLRIDNSQGQPTNFTNKAAAFDWIGSNCDEGTSFSLIQYKDGSLENMDRFTWDGFEFIEENISA